MGWTGWLLCCWSTCLTECDIELLVCASRMQRHASWQFIVVDCNHNVCRVPPPPAQRMTGRLTMGRYLHWHWDALVQAIDDVGVTVQAYVRLCVKCFLSNICSCRERKVCCNGS